MYDTPTSITDFSFDAEVLKSDIIVICFFWAEWSGPCKKIELHLNAIAAEFDQVKVVKLDIDENPNTTSRYAVLSLPTLVIFKNGQEVDRLAGVVDKAAIVEKFSPYIVVDRFQ